MSAVKRASSVYGTEQFTEIIQNCMAQDLSWEVRYVQPALLLSCCFAPVHVLSHFSFALQEPAKKWEKVLLDLISGGDAPEEAAKPAKELASA